MADFPALSPASRAFTPGTYPVAATAAMSGNQSQLLSGTAMIGSQLRLSFPKLSESDRLAVEAHYHGQQGGFLPFAVPAEVLSGFTAADFVLTGYRWIYARPPEVADFCGPFYDVSIDLESVPDEGAWLPGMLWIVGLSLAAGAASGATPLGTIGLSIAGGAVSPLTALGGLVLTMAGGEAATADLGTIGLSFAPGAASSAVAGNRVVGLHFDGNLTDTKGSQFNGDSGYSFVTSGQKFGSGAISLNNGNIISGNGSGSVTRYNYSTRDFVYRCWINTSDVSTQKGIAGFFYGDYNYFGMYVSGGQLVWQHGLTSGSGSQNYGAITANQLVFVELGRVSGVIRGSVDGVVSTNTLSLSAALDDVYSYAWLDIGDGSGAFILDDFELLIGEGPRTINFTPPTAAFS